MSWMRADRDDLDLAASRGCSVGKGELPQKMAAVFNLGRVPKGTVGQGCVVVPPPPPNGDLRLEESVEDLWFQPFVRWQNDGCSRLSGFPGVSGARFAVNLPWLSLRIGPGRLNAQRGC